MMFVPKTVRLSQSRHRLMGSLRAIKSGLKLYGLNTNIQIHYRRGRLQKSNFYLSYKLNPSSEVLAVVISGGELNLVNVS